VHAEPAGVKRAPTCVGNGVEGVAGAHGIAACCPKACGECGGKDCDKRLGGREGCCAADVKAAQKLCTSNAPPCVPAYGKASGVDRPSTVSKNKPPTISSGLVAAAAAAAMRENRSYKHFITQLYCSGALDGQCADLAQGSYTRQGECYWSSHKGGATWAPPAEYVRRFDSVSASRCLSRKRVLVLGDSMTRDFVYHVLDFLGRSIGGTGTGTGTRYGADVFGACLGTGIGGEVEGPRTGKTCIRNIAFGHAPGSQSQPLMCIRHTHTYAGTASAAKNETTCMVDRGEVQGLSAPKQLNYMFLTANDTVQMTTLESEMLRRQQPAYDVLVISCPILLRLLPNAYNYDVSREARHATISTKAASDALNGIGDACQKVLTKVRRHSPKVAVFQLGFAGLAGIRLKQVRGSNTSVRHLERDIFRTLNDALGLHCSVNRRHEPAIQGSALMSTYRLTSQAGVRVIDRLNTWGKTHRRDAFHPQFPASIATLQQLLNSLCG